jgi:predicted  nucleic acid-binding Zn-ribbon protein
MDAKTSMGTDLIGQLSRLQQVDRQVDRLQKKLDEVPVRLKEHTDRLAELDRKVAEQEQIHRTARAEADRAELEVRTKEERREKIKGRMNAPTLGAREYDLLREELAGVLADINSFSNQALNALERAEEAEGALAALRGEREGAQRAYLEAKAKLEGSLAGTRQEFEARSAERAGVASTVDTEALTIYERVRRKHLDALAVVDGTIDRAAGRIGNDLHCATCYMTITANDAIKVLEGKKIVQCKSCVRILYVP